VEGTRGVIEPGQEGHPILRGVSDVFGDTDVYEAHPPADCTVLLRGEVVAGLRPDAPAVAGKKNDPMQAIAWTREPKNESGNTNKVFVTTMGAATDLESEGLRRLLVNAIYWGLSVDVPARADVGVVGDYAPTDYGFDAFQRGVRPQDHALPARAGEAQRKRDGDRDGGGDDTPLAFTPGERIALVGNGLAVKIAGAGHFEARLHLRHPEAKLVVRGFGWPADEVGVQQRPDNYRDLDDPLAVFAPNTVVCCFGNNEVFAGREGIAKFIADYGRWLDATSAKFTKDGRAPRFVLLAPVAYRHFIHAGAVAPDAAAYDRDVAAYATALHDFARARKLRYAAMTPANHGNANGSQLGDDSLAGLARSLAQSLGGDDRAPAALDARLLAAIADKEWVHANDYRMLNGWYVYGGRRTHDTATFPAEYKKIRAMAAARDRHIWALAQGKDSAGPDDAATGELVVPKTMFGANAYSEPKTLHFATAAESAAAMRVADGLTVQPFASEAEFKDLSNPVQLNFDDQGRLWVACMPTYPQWRPGDPRPADKLVILLDNDRDGRADDLKVFYDQLHCPTGFEFFAGGVLVTSQPRLLFLQDTDGDDKADVVREVFDGFASDDTHHAIGAFEWSPGGLLHMLEGLHMSSTTETPWGPVRNKGPAGCWVLDPRRLHLRYFQTPGYGNPWCYVFDAHGAGIVGDGTSGQQHFDSLLSGAQFTGRSAPATVFDNEGMRPVIGSEFLDSRHLPENVQGQMVYACVINMHGLTRFTVGEDGSVPSGKRIANLLESDDAMFRPADPQIGPDGALWFADWCNPLIGHMQYSQRDPNRDKTHGRVFRLVAKDRPLLAPVTQHGKTIAEVVQQLREPESRTRYRARRWLRAQPEAQVGSALRVFLDGIDDDAPLRERLRTEVLWLQQAHDSVDVALLRAALAASSHHARAAAVHLMGDLGTRVPDALALLAAAARDPHPRVRLEALRGLSFFITRAALDAALSVTELPMDAGLDYALDACLSALAPVWQPALVNGEKLAKPGSAAAERLTTHRLIKQSEEAALKAMRRANDRRAPAADRKAAMLTLGELPGNAKRGQAVFGRICVACHRVGKTGIAVGPDLDDVGKRMELTALVEAIFDPNAVIEPRYALVSLQLKSGEALAGFVDAETQQTLTLRLPDGTSRAVPLGEVTRRDVLATSTMPEGLAQTLSASEMVDLVEYLQGLQ
jgi:putative heme-binding domain-containing protein